MSSCQAYVLLQVSILAWSLILSHSERVSNGIITGSRCGTNMFSTGLNTCLVTHTLSQ